MKPMINIEDIRDEDDALETVSTALEMCQEISEQFLDRQLTKMIEELVEEVEQRM